MDRYQKTLELIHPTHPGVDETRWTFVTGPGGVVYVQAWPDAVGSDDMQQIVLGRFGTEIVIALPEPAPIPGVDDGPGMKLLARLAQLKHKLERAGVMPDQIPPFVVHSSLVESALLSMTIGKPPLGISKLLSMGVAEFYGVRVAWSPHTDRYVSPDQIAEGLLVEIPPA